MDDAKARLLRWIDEDREEIVGFLCDFVRAKSPNPPGDTTLAAAHVTRFLERNQLPFRVIAPQATMPNIVGSFEGARPGHHLVLNGHIDVFPADEANERWTHGPWSGAIADGKIYGRGVADMKAGTSASIFTYRYLHRLRERLAGRLTLTAVSDEETFGPWGARYLMEHHPEVHGDCLLNGEPSSPLTIRFGEKGPLWLRFTVRTRGAHGAYTHLTPSATKLAARILAACLAHARSWLRERVCFPDTEDPVEAVVRTIAARGWAAARLGVETDSHYLTVQTYEALRRALPRATFVDFATALRELRLRKSPREIEYLRRAAAIADQAMKDAVAAAGEGLSEREAAIAASRIFLRLGADTARTGPITAGRRSGTLHGLLGDHRLGPGDLLHMELVPSVNGYSARLMRPTVIGPPSAEQADTAAQLIEIQDEQIAAMKPGAVARDVDRVCRARVLGAGLRESYDNFTGYTLGYYGATHPPRTSDFTRAFVPTADWVLEPGMVFHMYTGARGMAFSETVLVTAGGAERLTRLERRLFAR